MPLDGHSYLVAQGWSGKGSGLRHGAIARPLAIPRKKTLSGLGKDRDEAFPFWDHLYSVAAKTIQVKLCKDRDNDSDTDSSAAPALPALSRTSTGILSNKRPIIGTPASTSGSATPSAEASSSSLSANGPRMSLMASAKREAAKRGLYSRFFRGPVLGPDDDFPDDTKIGSLSLVAAEVLTNNNHAPIVVHGEEGDTIDKGSNQKSEKEQKELRSVQISPKGEEAGKRKGKKEKGRKDKRKVEGFACHVETDEIVHVSKRKRECEDTREDEDCGCRTKAAKRRRKRDALSGNGSEDAVPTEIKEVFIQERSKKRKKCLRGSEGEPQAVMHAERYLEAKTDVKEERKRRKEEKKKRREEKAEKRRRKEKNACYN